MIAYVKGKITGITDEAVLVEAHGIGYEIICPNPFQFQMEEGKEALVHTYHYVREDAQTLFGFKNTEDKFLFQKLLGVSGIGPKNALQILAGVNVEEFVAAIEREDDKFLTSFQGVGKKTARQMVLDLKGKLVYMVSLTAIEASAGTESNTAKKRIALEDAEDAMRALGYQEREIKAILPQLKKENSDSADQLIKKGLALLSQKK
ncbi:Holliday junction branch migration protein RuvA [Terribacillus saccharophilus]|uniref:Holliday junction branch migration protein RuvA n=1 Tax=Terribacillus saccharophilus TaxID=361277 RepID=UPI003981A8E7